MQTIHHGIPSHNFFAIAQPPTPGLYSEKIGQQFVIQSPKNPNEKCTAELVDMWRITLQELPDSYCLLTYGLPKAKLLPVLFKKYPLIHQKQQVHFYLLKKLH